MFNYASPTRDPMVASGDFLAANVPGAPTAGNTAAAAAALLDIVIFAGGDSLDLMPLSAFEQKCMLRIGNRPMIWYCLVPWVDAGFRTFFIVVNEDYATLRTYLSREFVGIEFHFVFVPSTIDDCASTTCDGVKGFLMMKEQMRAGTDDATMTVRDGTGESPNGPGRRSAFSGASSPSVGAAGAGSSRWQPLRTESEALPAFPRDALLLSCDTILAGVDVAHFVNSFYCSMASASALLFRPHTPAEPSAAEDRSHGGGKGHGKKKQPQGQHDGQPAPEAKPFSYQYMCVGYEEDDVVAAMSTGGAPQLSKGAGPDSYGLRHGEEGSGDGDSDSSMQHRRLHYMYPFDDEPELRITMAFAARRPNLTFAADVVDAHAYLVRNWVLEMIASSAGAPDTSVSDYIMPLLARSQHSLVNTAENVFITPDKKIEHSIPTHWLYKHREEDMSVSALNAAPGPMLPERADSLRVFCTIFTEDPALPAKVCRINSRDNYVAACQEVLLAKCSIHHLLDDHHLLQQQQQQQQQQGLFPSASPLVRQHSSSQPGASYHHTPVTAGLSLYRAASSEMLMAHGGGLVPGPGLTSSSALALLLPDRPFTLREKLGSQQMYIIGSFMESLPPTNTFITRSTIGAHVSIGQGARITDSVILANVEVGAKAVITNSVIGAGAIIEAGRRIVNSIVAPRCYVETDKQDTIIE